MREHNQHTGISKRVVRNSFSLLAAKGVDIAFSLLSMSIIARYLGADTFGHYAFIISVGALTSPLVDMGLKRIVIREMSKDIDNASVYNGTALFLVGIVSLVLLIAGALVILFTNSETVFLITLVVLSKIFLIFEMVFTGVFNAFEKMTYETLVITIRKIAYIGLLLLVVFANLKLPGIIAAIVLSNLVSALSGYIIIRLKFFVPRINMSWKLCMEFVKESYPLAVYAFILVLFYRIDIFFLKIYRSDSEIGLYQAASQFVLMWNIIPMSIASSLFPSFSRFAATDMERFSEVYRKSFKYLIILGLAIVVVLLFLADKIILVIYGSGFLDGTYAMRLFVWTLPMIFFNVLLSTILTAVKKQGYNTIAAIICVSINVVLDLLLVPRYGYIGACYATLISFVVLFLQLFHFVKRFVIPISLSELILKPAISVIIPVSFLLLLRGSPVIYLLPSLAIYFFMLYWLKAISFDDVARFKRILLRR